MPAFLAALLPFIGNALSSVVGGIGRLLMTGLTGAVGLIGRGLGTALQGTLRFIMGIPGMLLGAVRGLFGILGGLTSGLGSLIGVVGRVAGTLGGVFLGGLAAASAGLKLLTQNSIESANQARLLSAQTGLGINQSNGILSGFRSVGIDNPAIGGQNPAIFGMKARAYGVNASYSDPDFLARFASRFQQLNSQGITGNLMAQNMAKALGMDSPESLRAATYNPANIRSNQAYGRDINARLNVNPNLISRASEQLPLGLARLGVAFQAISQKVVGIALPYLEQGLNRTASFIGANAGKIGDALQTGISWIFDTMPGLLSKGWSLLTNGMASGVNGIIGIAGYLSEQLPPVLGGAIEWISTALDNFSTWVARTGPVIVNGVAAFVKGIGNGFSSFLNGAANFLDALDQSDPFKAIVKGIASSIDMLVGGLKVLAGGLSATYAAIQAGIVSSPIAKALAKFGITNIGGFDLTAAPMNPAAAFRQGYDFIPSTDVRGAADNFFNSHPFGNAANSLRGFANTQQGFFNNVAGGIQNYGMQGVNGLSGMAGNASQWLSPGGGPNKGQQLAALIGGPLGNLAEWLEKNVKPTTDLLNMSNGSAAKTTTQTKEATTQDRILSEMQKQTALLQQQVKGTGGGSASFDRVTAYVLTAWRKEMGSTIRAAG